MNSGFPIGTAACSPGFANSCRYQSRRTWTAKTQLDQARVSPWRLIHTISGCSARQHDLRRRVSLAKCHHAVAHCCQRKHDARGQQQSIKRVGEFLGTLQDSTYIVVMPNYTRPGRSTGVRPAAYDKDSLLPIYSATGSFGVSQRAIELRGVAVNNLRQVDLDLPHRELIVFCGVSGSGKTSMALDTLYAEGQRRYIESFSAYTRQFLEQLDKPQAERIDGIPPAIAVTHKNPSRSNRATVGTTTEVNEYLSLLFARVGEVICYQCGQPVRRDSPESAAQAFADAARGHSLDGWFRHDRAG